jgi:hypothetical protein
MTEQIIVAGIDFTLLFYSVPIGVTIIIVLALVGHLLGKTEPSDKSSNRYHTIDDSEEQEPTQTEDKTTKSSMDNYNTKEEHPLGDKTHD